jgi:hypothetical protein
MARRRARCAGAGPPLLALALLAAATVGAAAAPPPTRYDLRRARQAHGAYLGCFDSRALGLAFSGPAAGSECVTHCRGQQLPLYALNRALQCACTAALPAPEQQLPDGACEAGADDPSSAASGAGGAVPIFYVHGDAGQSCSLRRRPLGWEGFEAAYNPRNALFDDAGRALMLRMNGAEGVRVVSRDAQLYGMFSFRARASEAPGVITAAYVSLRLEAAA